MTKDLNVLMKRLDEVQSFFRTKPSRKDVLLYFNCIEGAMNDFRGKECIQQEGKDDKAELKILREGLGGN